MGREKGMEMKFLKKTSHRTLRSPGLITATMETIQGDDQKAQEAGDFFRAALMGIVWKKATGNLVHIIFVCFKMRKLTTRKFGQSLSANQEF